MLNQSSGQFTTRAADDRPNGARPIGQLNGSRVFRGAVGVKDKSDFYSFTLSGRSSFNLALNKLKNNVDVSLLQNGKTVARSTKGGKKPEAINTTLEAGTYFVKVSQKSGNSKYRLTLNATPDSGSTPDPIRPIPARNRLLSVEGNVAGVGGGGTRLGSIDLNTGIVTPLPTSGDPTALPWSDIAVFGNEGYILALGAINKLDPTTGAVTYFSNNKLNNTDLFALEFTPSGELYGVGETRTGAGFFKVDIANETVTLVSEIPGTSSSSAGTELVFDPSSSRFFAVVGGAGALGNQLVSIGLAGDTRLIGDIGFNGARVVLNAMLLDNGSLYGYGAVPGVNESRTQQYIINTTTGAITPDKTVTMPSENDDSVIVWG
jgi:hypothetical protein